jgi:hypothetical protein
MGIKGSLADHEAAAKVKEFVIASRSGPRRPGGGRTIPLVDRVIPSRSSRAPEIRATHSRLRRLQLGQGPRHQA